MNKAMMAFTKALKKSLNCIPTTIQKQMHEFGKGKVTTNRTKMYVMLIHQLHPEELSKFQEGDLHP